MMACEFVGLYILPIFLRENAVKKVGLYRDVELPYLHYTSGQISDKIRKDITMTFSENLRLKTANLKIVSFLDVTLDLRRGKYQLYQKSEEARTYINVSSNYPHNITKALPSCISKRISNFSSNKATFDNTALF